MLRVPENVYEITTNASYIVSLEQGYSHMKKKYSKKGKIFHSNSHWLCYKENKLWLWWVSFATCPIVIMPLNFESILASSALVVRTILWDEKNIKFFWNGRVMKCMQIQQVLLIVAKKNDHI